MKLDIGCGPKCLPGFVGVDRFPLPGVQVVADLNKQLPFDNDSIDVIHASHSLEHVSDLMFTMKEIFRVCKHKAQICIVAPYYEQKLNLANPYHLQVFNEHTPRFWTRCSWAPIDQKEYYHPHAVAWGLSESDNSDPGLEIRLLRMEFFYFPRFTKISPSLQTELRQNLTDVCHQIVYHLTVWKSDNDDDYVDLLKNVNGYPFLDTPALQQSRADSKAHQVDNSFVITHILELFSEKIKAQYNYIATCHQKLKQNDKLVKLLTGHPDLPEAQQQRLDGYLKTNYPSRRSRAFQLSKKVSDHGYIEYPIAGRGTYNSVFLSVYLSGESRVAQLGLEICDRQHNIIWNSVEELSHINTVGVLSFLTRQSLELKDVAFIRVYGLNLDVDVQIVECLVESRWPFCYGKLVPYACFSND